MKTFVHIRNFHFNHKFSIIIRPFGEDNRLFHPLLDFEYRTILILEVDVFNSVVYTGFRGCGGPGRIEGGTFLHWRNKKFPVFLNSKIFKKLSKNQCKISNFEKLFKFAYRNLNVKLIFYPFSLPSSRTFVI